MSVNLIFTGCVVQQHMIERKLSLQVIKSIQRDRNKQLDEEFKFFSKV